MKLYTSISKSLFVLVIGLLFCIPSNAQDDDKILYEGQFAPEFQVRDIEGRTHSIEQYKGKKILLTFYRNAGCPVSNNRLHELETERKFFEEKGVVLISIYESSIENVKLLADTNHFYQRLVADPEGMLYYKYMVEENKSKIARGMMHGAKQKTNRGKKLFGKPIKQDGKPNRITADFLIDENGNFILVYYAKYLGDHLPIELIKNKLLN
ncbi:MAG: redoxin domain-containing protein [Bacteroidota bacterium]